MKKRSGMPFIHRRRLLLAALLFPLLLLARPADAAGQTRADSAAILLATATRIGNDGRGEVAEALYDYILQRFGDTPAAERVRALRAVSPVVGRVGRIELQVWGTLYGAWLGIAVPLVFSADQPEPYGLGLLLGAPAGFFAARAYGGSRPLTEGQARAITWGGTWGTWQGLGWAAVFDIGIDTRQECFSDPPDCMDVEEGDATEENVAAAVAGGLAGIAVGTILSRKPISQGLATTVTYGSLWGTWIGLALGVITEGDDGDTDDRLLTFTLLGGDAGLITAAVFGPRLAISRNRVRLISLAGLVGGLAGGGLDLLVQPDDIEVAVGIPLATSLAGLIFGAYATRSFDDGGDGAASGALIDLRGGEWRVDVPLPMPAATRDPRTGRIHAAVHVPLIQARF